MANELLVLNDMEVVSGSTEERSGDSVGPTGHSVCEVMEPNTTNLTDSTIYEPEEWGPSDTPYVPEEWQPLDTTGTSVTQESPVSPQALENEPTINNEVITSKARHLRFVANLRRESPHEPTAPFEEDELFLQYNSHLKDYMYMTDYEGERGSGGLSPTFSVLWGLPGGETETDFVSSEDSNDSFLR